MTSPGVRIRPWGDDGLVVEVAGALAAAEGQLRTALARLLVRQRPGRALVDLSRATLGSDQAALGVILAACDAADDMGMSMFVRARDDADVRRLSRFGVPVERLRRDSVAVS